jgi:hypothetical protein
VEFLGAQVNIEVEEKEALNPPSVGTFFQVNGVVRRNGYNGSVSLIPMRKTAIAKDMDSLTDEDMRRYASGLRISGVGIVAAKDSSTVNRKTFIKASLQWQGATHEFKGLSPELYQRIPAVKSYVRFWLGILAMEERNRDGQKVMVQKPTLLDCRMDDIETGSVPSKEAAAAQAGAATPPKQAAATAVGKT